MEVYNNMEKRDLEILFQTYMEGGLSEEARELFFDEVKKPENASLLFELSERYPVPESYRQILSEGSSTEILSAILSLGVDGSKEHFDTDSNNTSEQAELAVPPIHRIHFIRRLRWVAAAVLILLAGLAYYSWFYNEQPEQQQILAEGIAPGKEGAKLKLSDGRIVLIDSLQDGLIATDGTVQVYKENGQIVYKGRADEVIYNEIVTDKGRQWSAQLPDGSIVWLNAASSLRYPLQFNGKERLVAMTGEASFNVVHNDKQPFRVQVKDQLIEDIGTEFNINAYDNEAKIITTVVEGVASVSSKGQKVIVNAGKQAAQQNGTLAVSEADTDKAIAWRKGLFNFEGADIQIVGRQLERWYNIEVVYEPNLPNFQFGGGTFRSNNLQEVLKVLELSGVRFRLEAGDATIVAKLIVLP